MLPTYSIETMPLPIYSLCMNVSKTIGEDELIISYFKQGYTNLEILEFLQLHNIEISLSTLKRRLHSPHEIISTAGKTGHDSQRKRNQS